VAGLGKQTVTVIRAGGPDDGDIVLTIPAYGRVLNTDVDDDNGRLYVATMNAGPIHAVDVSTSGGYSATIQDLRSNIVLGYELVVDQVNNRLYAADAQPTLATRTNIAGEAPVNAQAGAGAPGAQGPAGPAGPLGNLRVDLSLGQVKLVGSSASVRVPGAGTAKVVVKAGSTTIAQGSKTVTKAGTVKVTLTKTAKGKALLRKRAVKATLTATFTPKGAATVKSVRAAKVTLKKLG
jgi:hypothetical protein